MIKLKDILQELIIGDKVQCDNCDWNWKIADGGDDLYMCHKCGHNNTPKLKELDEVDSRLLNKNQAEDKMIQSADRVLDKILNQVRPSNISSILNNIVDKDNFKELVINELKPVRDHFYNRYSKCYKYDQAGDEKIIIKTLQNIANIFLSRINDLNWLKTSAIKTYMYVSGNDSENLVQNVESSLNSKDSKRIQTSALLTVNTIIGNMRRVAQISVYGPSCKGADKSNTPENSYPYANTKDITKKIIDQYTPLYIDAIINKFG